MKQIKTIKNKLDNNEVFDDKVNAALAEGWKLVNRGVSPGSVNNYPALYAELEREIPETKRCCEACGLECCTDAPCNKCNGATLKKEAET